jgi:hypothetical protein
LKRNCGCGRPMPGTHAVCGACIGELERALGNVAFYADQLQVTFSRQARTGSGGGRRGGERPLPYNPRAAHAGAKLRAVLITWVNVVEQAAGAPLPGPACVACKHPSCRRIKGRRRPGGSLGQMSRWLLLHIDTIRQHESGATIADTIVTAVCGAESAVDRPAERVYSGPCDECGKDMYGRLGAVVVACLGCGLEYDVAARVEWLMVAAEDVLATAIEISRAMNRLGVELKVDRIYQWVSRKRLIPAGLDANRRSLYRFGDVLDLLGPVEAKPEREKVGA